MKGTTPPFESIAMMGFGKYVSEQDDSTVCGVSHHIVADETICTRHANAIGPLAIVIRPAWPDLVIPDRNIVAR